METETESPPGLPPDRSTVRISKIARLPHTIREELNRRLLDGQPQGVILPWLNGLPAVQEVLRQQFQGVPVSEKNLSDWRHSGYADWLLRRERTERTKELAHTASELAQANGGNISQGALAIIGGHLFELLDATSGKLAPEQLASMVDSLVAIRSTELAKAKGDLDREKLARKDSEIELARQKFQQDLREYQDKVAAQKAAIEGELTKARSGGITPETLARIEEAVRIL